MKTVLMAIAVIKDGNKILLRKFDPQRNPYKEPWGLFGGRLEGEGTTVEMLNRELQERWSMSVRISEQLSWDEDKKADLDGEEKRFIYLDAICELVAGEPRPTNPNEELKWVEIDDLSNYEHVPPSIKLLKKLGYLK